MIDLKRLRRDKNIKQNQLAELLGVGQSLISSIERGTRNISTEIYHKLAELYPDLNDYRYENGNKYETSTASPIGLNIKIVKLVNKYSYAGFMNGHFETSYYDDLPDYPFFGDHDTRGNYLAFEVIGESMFDGTDESIKDGDVVIGKEVPRELWSSGLHMKKWSTYVIAHSVDGLVVKNITDLNFDDREFIVHSLNPEWDDRLYKFDDIVKLYHVKKVIRDRR